MTQQRDKQCNRRNSEWLFLGAVALAMGSAFGIGYHLRSHSPSRLALRPLAQIAQIGHVTRGQRAADPYSTEEAPETGAAESLERSRRSFDTIYSLVRQYYVDRLPGERQMSYGAIRQMLASLNDPLCYFLEPDQFALLEAESAGRYHGVGASFTVHPQKRDGYTDYKVVTVSALPASPAATAGLRPGDIVTHINGRWILGYRTFLNVNRLAKKLEAPGATRADEEAYQREVEAARKKTKGGIQLDAAQMILRGDHKTLTHYQLPTNKLTLTVDRPGTDAPLELEMPLGVTEAPAIEARLLPAGEGYIRIAAFTEQTDAQFRQALSTVKGSSSLILDLRGNPGGTMEGALAVEALLVPKGSSGYFALQVPASGKPVPVKSRPAAGARRAIAVLVDSGTASVAEALAASLTDKGAATLVGRTTFGDSTLQAAYTLPDGAAFVAPTGRLLSPVRQRNWAFNGLKPEVPLAPGLTEAQVLAQVCAALRQHTQIAESGVTRQ